MAELTIILAFVAGIVSFLSPCILPIIPGYMAFLSGNSDGGKNSRMRTFLNSVAFVLGFSLVFAALGVLLNTLLESSSFTIQTWLARIGGVIIIVFALHLIGIIKIPFLMMDHKFEMKNKFSKSYVSSFVFGAAFAVGWSPCVGAILGSVLALAATMPGIAFGLLLAYAIGLGIPFLLVGLFTEQAMTWIRKYSKFMKYFNWIVGILLLALGVLVFTNQLSVVANFLVPVSVV